MITLISAVVILTGLGIAFALGLSYAATRFAVETDPRMDSLLAALPGLNCGTCGFAGCSGYAEALLKGEAKPGQCPPGGEKASNAVAAVLGVEFVVREKEVAVLLCRGKEVDARFKYDGIPDCRAAALLQGGQKRCEYGCLGFGTCAQVCPVGAIAMKDGLPEIDEERCVGCRLCEKSCPRKILSVRPVTMNVHVLCRSNDRGAVVTKICKMGCIACKKCEKVCKYGAIKVENFLAMIDAAKCTQCGDCVKECPMGVIADFRERRRGGAKPEAA